MIDLGDTYREPTLKEIQCEALVLVVSTDFRLSMKDALNNVVKGFGWVNIAHCISCKTKRGAD